MIFASSGTGAWEAGLVNTLSPGDKVLMFETGHFATLWKNMALRLGLEVDFVPGDWRHGVDPAMVEAKLAEDRDRKIKSVNVVHNETSTGVPSRIAEIRKAIDRTGHPALFMVDTISSLGSVDYRHDEWGVDVTVGCSQKGLMLPPGLGFNAISDKALAASKNARLPRSYWAWDEILAANKTGFFHSSPATNLLYGLREALRLLEEEGLENVFARHARHGEATRRALKVWGIENLCLEPAGVQPDPDDGADAGGEGGRRLPGGGARKVQHVPGERPGEAEGPGLPDRPPGDFNDLSLIGTLGGVEMGFALAGVPHQKGGVMAAMDYLAVH